jgi:hypothetical protein
MARYGIDRALLAAQQPETDQPTDRKIDIGNPWARVQGHLLCGLASAMRCQCVILPRRGPGVRIHIFGFASDIERTDVLYTSVLVQMWHGLAAAEVPSWNRRPRAWRRSWLLGFTSAVVARVRAAEQRAAAQAGHEHTGAGPGTQLVLADRAQIIERTLATAYPRTRPPASPGWPTAAAATAPDTPKVNRPTWAAPASADTPSRALGEGTQ